MTSSIIAPSEPTPQSGTVSQPSSIAVCVPVSYRLIQEVRLVHAIMESSYRVHVPAEHADKFSRLRRFFGVDFDIGVTNARKLPAKITHPEPRTTIGSLERALIFPAAIPRYCRGLWSPSRALRFSFAGLVTEQRREVLDAWIRRGFAGSSARLKKRSLFERATTRVRRKLGLEPLATRRKIGELVLWSSDRGRRFPGKSWDEEYHALLAESQFVLCPNGDFVWSYRFFEATLCGAIPIVEESCAAYNGFHYRTLKDPPADLEWSSEQAEHNFALAVERLTVPKAELNAQIEALISAKV